MIQSKKIDLIVACAVVFALVVSAALVVVGREQRASSGTRRVPEYAEKIFGTEIISIDIIADEDAWQQMLDNALDEQFIMVDVVINGEKFRHVGIRPKGNSSLTQVANSNSDRYSFRLQFDEYVDGQTAFGLQSFVLNNMLGDYTYMKEYISYDLMREVGVAAPYFGFAQIKVNGEDWGLYLAVELYNDSYKQRVFGDTRGMLYNVKSMDLGGFRGSGGNQPNPQGGGMPWQPGAMENLRNQWPMAGFNQVAPQGFPGFPGQLGGEERGLERGFGGWGGMGGTGGSLEYIDDEPSSYPAIFQNVVGKGTQSDFKRVIRALKALAEGEDLERYFDVDQILRYLAAHTVVVNLDSYSSTMAQNYYLYERDGRITILPWDYNLAWGGFQSGNASAVVNFPIDTPVSGVDLARRPLIAKLLAVPEYLERYHSYLQQIIDNYFADGKFEAKVRELDALIGEHVKNDPTAFCTYDQYQRAVSTLITLGNLRAQSIQGQLDGTIPSTTEGQRLEPGKLIAPGNLNLLSLGTMMMGGRGGEQMGFPGGFDRQPMGRVNQPRQPGGAQQAAPARGFAWGGGSPLPGESALVENLKLTGVLVLVLLAAIVFAARFRHNY